MQDDLLIFGLVIQWMLYFLEILIYEGPSGLWKGQV